MLKKLFLSSFILLSVSQVNVLADSGSIVLRDGSRGVRITIGSDRMSERDLRNRVITLEKAVRDLQNEVYNLRDSQPVSQWICEMEDNFGKTYYSVDSESFSESAARRSVKQECQKVRSSMFCDNRIKCSN